MVCRMCRRSNTALLVKVSGRLYSRQSGELVRWCSAPLAISVRSSALCFNRDDCRDHYRLVTSGATPHLDPTLDPVSRLWWLAEELSSCADAIGPVPELAERALRAHADDVRAIVKHLREHPTPVTAVSAHEQPTEPDPRAPTPQRRSSQPTVFTDAVPPDWPG